MAILVHHRDFDQQTPHGAARAALSQANLWGAAEALGLEISPELGPDDGMDLYISGPLHHIRALYDAAAAIGTQAGIRHVEVDCREDEQILRRCLGANVHIVSSASTTVPNSLNY